MSDLAPPPTRVPWPWGFLGMLALMLAAERFVARHEHDLFLKVDHWTWRQSGRLADTTSPNPRIVCLGDSLVQVGIASPIIESQTGRRTCNLAISGGQAVSTYLLLRRALEAGVAPDAVLVDFFPRLLEASPLEGADPWSSLAGMAECADLAWTARRPVFFARVAAARLLPAVRARDAIRENLRAALGGQSSDDAHHVPPALVRNLHVNRGGVLCPPNPGRGGDVDDWARRHFPPSWTCHPVNELYLRRFLALAQARRIPVFWLLPPIEPGLQARCEASGFDARHESFVRAVVADCPNVTVLDGRRAGYDRRVFFDPHHLGRTGAAVFSDDVARAVRTSLERRPASARPRWVDLPRYREAPIDVPLEDIEQSRWALRTEKAQRRR